jgi:hypothetical protein
MAQLTPGVTINSNDIVTRQTIYDLVRLATIGTVQQSDLDSGVLTVVSQSLAPTPSPGLLWWNQTEQLMMVYTDMIDNTGASVWLAIGPDRFDVAVYAEEPIPYGAAVVPGNTGGVRAVRLPPHPSEFVATGVTVSRFSSLRVLGLNQETQHGAGGTLTAPTTPSGTWFRCATVGVARGWAPVFRTFSEFGTDAGTWVAPISGWSGLSGASGISDVRGGIMNAFGTNSDFNTGGIEPQSFFARSIWRVRNEPGTPSGGWGRYLLTGPRWR